MQPWALGQPEQPPAQPDLFFTRERTAQAKDKNTKAPMIIVAIYSSPFGCHWSVSKRVLVAFVSFATVFAKKNNSVAVSAIMSIIIVYPLCVFYVLV